MAAIVNASAGQGGAGQAEWLKKLLGERYGIDLEVFLADNGEAMRDHARRAAQGPWDLVIAAGGDGTVSTVAAQLLGTDKRLGVLPLGTLNHFAKDLKIPLEAEAAAINLLEGKAVRIDAASVNGHLFLNNSSLGMYPRAVVVREQQQKSGWQKWLAWVPAVWATLNRFPVMAVRLTVDNQEFVRRTALVFIANNRYQLEGWGMGTRECLDDGTLQVSVMHHSGIGAMLRMVGFAFFGKLHRIKEIDSLCSRELWIECRRRRLSVALDGEVSILKTPLHYQIHPRALAVMVPYAA